MTCTKHLTQQNKRSKIVFKGKKGMATYPKKVAQMPVPQEKLWEEYWK